MKSKTLFLTSILAAAAMSTVPAMANSDLIWAGGSSGTWNTTTKNWSTQSSISTPNSYWTNGDDATFWSKSIVTLGSAITAGDLFIFVGSTVTLTGDLTNRLTVKNGAIIYNSATLNLGSYCVLSGKVTVQSGGTLNMYGNALGSGAGGLSVTLDGGTLTNTGSSTDVSSSQLYNIALSDNSTVSGSGNFGLVGNKNAATTLSLAGKKLTKTGSNTFWLANTTISGSGGVLEATSGKLAGASGQSVTLGAGVTLKTSGTAGVSNLTLASMGAGSKLILSGSTASSATISGAAGTSSSLATIEVSNGNKVSYTNATAKSLNANITVSGSGSTFAAGAANQLNSDGSASISLKNGGTLALGSNSWTLGANNALSLDGGNITGTSDSGNLVFASAKTISVGNTSGTVSNISASMNLGGDTTLDIASGASLNVSGKISGDGKFIKSGAGTLNLSSDNSNFSSDIDVSAGTLVVQNENALGTGTVSVGSGAKLELGAEAVSFGTLSGSGTVALASGTTSSTLTVNQTSGSTTGFSGTLASGITLAKTGTGTLTLSGDNSASTANVTINGGVLEAISTNALGMGTTTINDGALLKISVNGGVNAGAVTFAEGAQFAIDLANASIASGDILSIISSNDGIQYNGSALTASEAEKILAVGSSNLGDYAGWKREWAVEKTENGGSKLTLKLTDPSAVPEPSMFGLLAGIGALAFVAARRRRNAK